MIGTIIGGSGALFFAVWALLAERRKGSAAVALAECEASLDEYRDLSRELADEIVQIAERTKRQIASLEADIEELENVIMELEDDRLPGPDPLRAFASLRSIRATADRIARDHGEARVPPE